MEHKQVNLVHKLKEQINSKGIIVVLFFAAIPLVPFDVIGIAAGLVEMSPLKFFAAAAVGKTIRFTIIGFAAAYGLTAILKIFGLAT
jgi:membrane protein YqaA with SNARE-associated domain